MDLKNKKVLIVGFGKSGEASLRFILSKGARPAVTDMHSAEHIQRVLHHFNGEPIEWFLGSHPRDVFLNAELIVVSPGVPWNLQALQEARAKKIPVINEIELAILNFNPLPKIIAVTGTNGKTTTVSLIHHLFQTAGKKSVLAGNIGQPMLSCQDKIQSAEFLVLEISSYQLVSVPSLKPDIAVWLNITEDHLDWHENFESYLHAKSRLVRQTDLKGGVVYNADDPVVSQAVEQIPSQRRMFSAQRRVKLGGWVEEGKLMVKNSLTEPLLDFDLSKIPLKGIHNWENMLAALLAVAPYIKDAKILQRGLESFTPLPHRMQIVRELGGVTYINDSKGTNVGAAVKALAAVRGPILWIAGGRDKGGDYAPLCAWVKKKCRAVFLLGEAKEKMALALEGCGPMTPVRHLKEAVLKAHAAAKVGDTVLLSPACSSFDMFKDYAERGNAFMKLVGDL